MLASVRMKTRPYELWVRPLDDHGGAWSMRDVGGTSREAVSEDLSRMRARVGPLQFLCALADVARP